MNIAIIPARSGSKRVKNKNLIEFFGKPIIYYSISAAIKSKLFDRVIVSTDSTRIKKIAEKYGAEVPFMRPKKLSQDSTLVKEVIEHGINFLQKKKIKFKYVCCIYATAPLVQISDIKKGFTKIKSQWKYVFSACKFEKSIMRSFILDNQQKTKYLLSSYHDTNTQDLPNTYFDAGQFYWMHKKDWLRKKISSLRGTIILIGSKYVQDFDNKEDLKILKEKYKKIYKNNGI
jgi:pseudaminic acid cytidylyltransferase